LADFAGNRALWQINRALLLQSNGSSFGRSTAVCTSQILITNSSVYELQFSWEEKGFFADIQGFVTETWRTLRRYMKALLQRHRSLSATTGQMSIKHRALLQRNRALLQRNRALLRRNTALSLKNRSLSATTSQIFVKNGSARCCLRLLALLRGYRALLRRYRALSATTTQISIKNSSAQALQFALARTACEGRPPLPLLIV